MSSDFTSHREQADALVNRKGIFAICKTTRAGTTTNTTLRSIENKRKTVLVTNSNDLIREIKKQAKLLGHDPKIEVIPDNVTLCRKLDRGLKLKFQLKKRCSGCQYNNKPSHCLYQKLLTDRDVDVYLITYEKLETMQKTHSKLLSLFNDCKNVTFDEVGVRVLRSAPIIQPVRSEKDKITRASEIVKEQFKAEIVEYERILETNSDFMSESDAAIVRFWSTLESVLFRIENSSEPGKHRNRVDDVAASPDDFSVFWRYITKLEKKGKDTSLLQELFPLMLCQDVFITIKKGNVYATPIEDTLIHLREFCKKFDTVLLVDACHPALNYDKIFGTHVEPVLWLDPHQTDRSQLILCDRHHFNADYFLRYKSVQYRVENVIRSFDFDPDETFVVCLNKRIAKEVTKWQIGDTTWFRSSRTRGLQAEGKSKMFTVLGPYIPMTSFDALANSWPDEYFLENLNGLDDKQKAKVKSLILRQQHESSEFTNCIGRIKDFLGKKRSIVITVGMVQTEVDVLLNKVTKSSWPPIQRPATVQPIRKGGLAKDGPWTARLWLDGAEIEIEDLPIVARIIAYTKNKQAAYASEIYSWDTDLVKNIAQKYQAVLEKYGITFALKTSGVSFEAYNN